ncbi:hypothetical protein Tco_0810293 [Tanacetum coccineum]
MALPHPLCRSPPSPSLISLNTIFQTDTEENIDVNLPSIISVLKSVGCGECWNKHGSLLDYLFDTYHILKLWGAPDAVCLCGLAIFDPSTGSNTIRTHVGEVAEQLIHLFCVIPHLVHDDLLFHYPDESEL